MILTSFPESNTTFKAPSGLDESQVAPIPAYHGTIEGGSLDGEAITVVAWKPLPHELDALKNGASVFLTTVGGLPPHCLSTDFVSATHPA